jgi:hypothetical protein
MPDFGPVARAAIWRPVLRLRSQRTSAVRAALDQELARFGDHAIDASMLLIALDESAESAVASALSGRDWDVVVIGRGIRKPDPLLLLFEQAVNLVRRYAPKAAIAFNTSGGDSVEAARRWV